jgi:ribose 5-phosphate isomerase A
MNDKEQVARAAAEQIASGMLVGLGTGSTANLFITELARRQRDEGLQVSTVASSAISATMAENCGLSVLSIEQISALDVYVDGADEVTPALELLKGQGADLVREKLLASASSQFWVLVDGSKVVERIGQNFAIPIEVPTFAWRLVKKQLETEGGVGELRLNAAKSGYALSSQGNFILDTRFTDDLSASALNDKLNSTTGLVEHGIFYSLASTVWLGNNGDVEQWQAAG